MVDIAYSRLDGVGPDSIAAYSARLAAALEDEGGVAVRCCTPEEALAGGPEEASLPRTVLLQYNPFSYGRLGVAPTLVRSVHRARRRRGAPRIALMVHEPFVALDGPRTWLLTSWHRTQLGALCAGAETILAASEAWAATVQRLIRDRRAVLHVPVGSTLPDRRADRAGARQLLTVADGDVVVAHLGTRHASRLDGHVVAAVNAVAERRPVLLLNLGADAPPLPGLASGVRIRTPGWLEEDELGAMLSAADVFLSPCVDGVSTRRTSLMAALQHQIAVVGTVTAGTDAVLREAASAVRLAAVADVNGFAEATAALAEDGRERRRAGRAARRLYEEQFDWPVIAARLRGALRLDPA
jgi:glycosyltransferase involved in cell wall biosynthesis